MRISTKLLVPGWALLSALALVSFLASCSSGSYAPTTTHFSSGARTSTSSYQVLHNFGVGFDGKIPVAGLIAVNGTLYGTTYNGGAYYGTGAGLGTVFSITTTGTESVLYSFGHGGAYDGANPNGGLIAVNGTLYGTTLYGGTSGYAGTVFSITTTGTESVLHNFGQVPGDGANPFAGLIAVRGKLYGTTCCGGVFDTCPNGQGGYFSCGTVFKLTTTGREHVLHSFGYGTDGRYPQADLLNVRGTLYGTTTSDPGHHGTVFKVSPSTGEETVLYSFRGGYDGSNPYFGSLVLVDGVLYGTTTAGGGTGCTSGCGTVFSVTTSGSEHVVYSFKGGNDGAGPYAGLYAMGGKLYGTTQFGGNTGCYENLGCGTIFSLTPSGKERILHTFAGGSDGENPASNLLNFNGVLYGTTTGSGNSSDWGTVFSLTP